MQLGSIMNIYEGLLADPEGWGGGGIKMTIAPQNKMHKMHEFCFHYLNMVFLFLLNGSRGCLTPTPLQNTGSGSAPKHIGYISHHVPILLKPNTVSVHLLVKYYGTLYPMHLLLGTHHYTDTSIGFQLGTYTYHTSPIF